MEIQKHKRLSCDILYVNLDLYHSFCIALQIRKKFWWEFATLSFVLVWFNLIVRRIRLIISRKNDFQNAFGIIMNSILGNILSYGIIVSLSYFEEELPSSLFIIFLNSVKLNRPSPSASNLAKTLLICSFVKLLDSFSISTYNRRLNIETLY